MSGRADLTRFRQAMTERARAKVTDPTLIEYIADLNLLLDMVIRELPDRPSIPTQPEPMCPGCDDD